MVGAGDEQRVTTAEPDPAAGAEPDLGDQPLVWIDLEMTGLDPETELIVEIATIITDGSLDHAIEGPELVVHAPDDVLGAMDEVVVAMHSGSGLTPLIRESRITVEQAQQATLEFVTTHIPKPRTAPLAGNSVHADRAFLRRYMPELEAYLHYRNVDVSTFKEASRRWAPDVVAGAPRKGGAHRALADIRESINELRYYRDTLYGDLRSP